MANVTLPGLNPINGSGIPAGVTVSVVDPTMLPEVALIVVVPAATPVAKPVALIVAVAMVPDAQTTAFVRFCVELLL